MRTKLIQCLIVLLMAAGPAFAACGVRLLLGNGATGETRWDGSVKATGARIASIEQWRFDLDDAITGPNSWRASTHKARLFSGGRTSAPPFVANGVIVWLDHESETTRLDVSTAQGDFSVTLRDLPYGAQPTFLAGRASATRLPPVSRITESPDEQAYPAAGVGKNGEIWLAYLEFRHRPDHDSLRTTVPSDFGVLASPALGDQILLRKFAGDRWGEPIAITPPGGDLYRPAIAVDGSGRPWVFWPENRGGNFDIWARAIEGASPGKPIRISSEAGADIDPAAVADSAGRVWVAWQGWRNGRASIFAATQNGDTFSPPVAVASSQGNEWDPAIAADGHGRVTVAWDSYRNGNYDVYARTATRPGAWGREFPIAVSACYEAYPSIIYDRDGRLWAAYEEGAERWAKDWGAYETTGVSIYQGRAIRLAVRDAAGRFFRPRADAGDVLPGFPAETSEPAGSQNDVTNWLAPMPKDAAERGPNLTPPHQRGPRNSLPRLAIDPSGRVWLAFRSANPLRWSELGYVWAEHVISYDGAAWSRPVYIAHSDNVLDMRPALAASRAGELTVVTQADGRGDFQKAMGPSGNDMLFLQRPRPLPDGKTSHEDPYNNDLWSTRVTLPPATGVAALQPVPAPTRSGPADPIEIAAVRLLRNYRVEIPGGKLRIVRGEFHRHSAVSSDGGSDGTLLDQWRYMIDAASMDWVGCCDHDNGGGREYSWWITQKLTDVFYSPGKFTSLFSYERSVSYPEGHRNVLFVQRGIRPLPRLPKMSPDSTGHAPDTQLLYGYLKRFDGVVAVHTSGTGMGTDWRDNDPATETAVEIYQGDRQNYEMPGAPRSMTEQDTIGSYRPKGFINLALEMGYKLAFQASSDHLSTHMSYCNILAADDTREALLDALKKRHLYGSTDDILAEVRCGTHIMGDAFTTRQAPELKVLLSGTAAFSKVQIVRDNRYVYSIEPRKARVEFTWRDADPAADKVSYYYVRGEQTDGEIVWASPMWIRYQR